MHIDMKLNFMHILAKLGFDGVYTIYWIKESKACHKIYWVNMHTQDFQEPKENIIWTKTLSKQRNTQECNTINVYPNYI